jgi:hypothetical protein
MSKTPRRPDDQPNHRRTARNVSRASSAPGMTSMSMPLASRTASRTVSALPASRTADVANAITVAQPFSSASARASTTYLTSRETPSASTAPVASMCSERRSDSLNECAGTGAPPRWASTISRCPVLDPMSSTPMRMAPFSHPCFPATAA